MRGTSETPYLQRCETPEGKRDNIRQVLSYQVENPGTNEKAPDRLASAFCWVQLNPVAVNSGNVYVIRAGDFIKIGVAKDVATRLKTMQTGCPYLLEIIRTIPCARPFPFEHRLKAYLHAHHYRGEWFEGVTDHVLDAALLHLERYRRGASRCSGYFQPSK